VELDTEYCKLAASRLLNENTSLFGKAQFQIELKQPTPIETTALKEGFPEYRIHGRRKISRDRQ
jgi:hypothetical protein